MATPVGAETPGQTTPANRHAKLTAVKRASSVNADIWARIDALSPSAEAGADRVDAFVAQVRAEIRTEREREVERARLIAMTNATPAGDAPRIGPDTVPIE
jgi:hypothetical protein